MSEDYTDNNTNDLTNALRTYGETKGSERYRRSLTQTVTRTNAKGEKVSKEVEVKDAERLHVVTRIIDDAADAVVAKIDEKVEEEAARAATDVGGQPRKGLAQIAGVDYTAAAMTALNMMWECVGKSQDRSRRVQLIGKRCESVALHQAMSDQMGYKAQAAVQEGQAQLRGWRNARTATSTTRQSGAKSSLTRGTISCAPMSAPRCTMR